MSGTRSTPLILRFIRANDTPSRILDEKTNLDVCLPSRLISPVSRMALGLAKLSLGPEQNVRPRMLARVTYFEESSADLSRALFFFHSSLSFIPMIIG